MVKWPFAFCYLLMTLLLVSCNFPMAPGNDDITTPESTGAQRTLSARLTDRVSASQTADRTPAVTQTPSPSPIPPTTTPIPTAATLQPILTVTTAINCDRAAAGNPFDITIPDDTLLKPGQEFSKTWRLVNTGECTWDRQYAAVFFSGDLLEASRTNYLNEQVSHDQSVDITVDMVAPLKTGSYQGNWKLRNPQGNLFGIGPGGNAPFWVRIIVIEPDTPTPPPPPTVTPTPVVYVSGLADLKPGESLDLDTKQPGTGSTGDLLYTIEPGKTHRLTPENGARAAQFGLQEPRIGDCRSASLSANPLALDTLTMGIYLCYRTNLGLPGWARLVALNDQDNTLTLEILTWAIP